MDKNSYIVPVERLKKSVNASTEKAHCYIVETDNAAGVFLQSELGHLTEVYGTEIRIEPYACYSEAEGELLDRYSELAPNLLTLNRLYWAKDMPLFSVFDFGSYAVATSSKEHACFLASSGNKVGEDILFENGLTYDEVQNYFWNKISELMGKKYLVKRFDLPVEEAFFFTEVIQLLEQESGTPGND